MFDMFFISSIPHEHWYLRQYLDDMKDYKIECALIQYQQLSAQ